MSKIAYLGPSNTNTHLAAIKRFGPTAKYEHAPTVEDVFRTVELEEVDYGVIPIENSLEGAVTHTLDRFVQFKQTPARIVGEIELPIRHCFITLRKTPREKVKVIYSHPQAFAQCQPWLDKNFPNATRRETRSTADAIVDILSKEGIWGRYERASIGSPELAKQHKLKAIAIPVDRDNRTRFLIISSTHRTKRGKRNKTSLMFALKDKPGALHDALIPFKNCGINLTKIESRPTKQRAWEYVFFVDIEGHESDRPVKRALKALDKGVSRLLVLGSYPVGGNSGRG